MTPHLMLDVETLSTRVGAIVTSVAFVRFHDMAHMTVNLSISEQQALGLEIDPDTNAWWAGQSDAAKYAAFSNPAPLLAALDYITQWVTWACADPLVWCHGATFDAPILTETYRRVGRVPPWKFWNVRDTRTLYDLAGINVKDFAVPPPHVALNDAIGQTNAAKAALGVLASIRGIAA